MKIVIKESDDCIIVKDFFKKQKLESIHVKKVNNDLYIYKDTKGNNEN